MRLAGSGSYNGTPVELEADLASFDALRDAATPYPAEIYVTSGDTTGGDLECCSGPIPGQQITASAVEYASAFVERQV